MATKLRVEIEDATQKGVAAVQKSIDQLETQIKRVNKELGSNANRGTSGSDPELARQAAVQKSLEETLKILANAEKQLRQAFSQEDVLKRLRDSIVSIGGPTDFVDEQIAKLGESMESIRFQADDAAVAYKKAFKDIGDSLDPAKAAAFQRAFEDVQRSISGGITKAAVKEDIAANKQLASEYQQTQRDNAAAAKQRQDEEEAAYKEREQQQKSEAKIDEQNRKAWESRRKQQAKDQSDRQKQQEKDEADGLKRRQQEEDAAYKHRDQQHDAELKAIQDEDAAWASLYSEREAAERKQAAADKKAIEEDQKAQEARQKAREKAKADTAKLRDSEVSASQTNALKDLQEESRLLDRLATKYKNLQREKSGFEAKATGARVGVGDKTDELKAVQKQIEANEKSQEIARRNAATSQAAADKLKALEDTHQSLTEQAKLLNVAINELSNSEVAASNQAEELQRQMSTTRREFNDTGAALSELIRKTEELGIESEKTARARKNAGSAVQSVRNTDAADVLAGGAVNSTQQNAEISRNTQLIKENEAAERSHAQTLQASAKSLASMTQRIQTELILRRNNVASIRENIEALKSQQAAGVNVTSELTQQQAALERQERLVDKLSGRFDVLRTELVGSEQDLRQYVTQLRASGESSPEVLRLVRALEELAIASDKIDGKEMAQEQKTAERAFQSSQKAVEAYIKSVEELQNRLSAQNARVSGLVSESSSTATQIAETQDYIAKLKLQDSKTKESREQIKLYEERLESLKEKLQSVRGEAERQQSLAGLYETEAEAALRDAHAHGVLATEKSKLDNIQGRLSNRRRRNELGVESVRAREAAISHGLFRQSIEGVSRASKRNAKVLLDAAQAWLLNTRASNEFYNSVQRGDKGGAGPASFGAIVVVAAATAMGAAFKISKDAIEELAASGDEAAKVELERLNNKLMTLKASARSLLSTLAEGKEKGLFGSLAKAGEESLELLADAIAREQLGMSQLAGSFDAISDMARVGLRDIVSGFGSFENSATRFIDDLLVSSGKARQNDQKRLDAKKQENLLQYRINDVNKALLEITKRSSDEAIKAGATRLTTVEQIAAREMELRRELSDVTNEQQFLSIKTEMVALSEREAEIRNKADESRKSNLQEILKIEQDVARLLQRKLGFVGQAPAGGVGPSLELKGLDREISTAEELDQVDKASDLKQRRLQLLAQIEKDTQEEINELGRQGRAADAAGLADQERMLDLRNQQVEAQQQLANAQKQTDAPSEEVKRNQFRLAMLEEELRLTKEVEKQRGRQQRREGNGAELKAAFEALERVRKQQGRPGQVRGEEEINQAIQATRETLGRNVDQDFAERDAAREKAELLQQEITALEKKQKIGGKESDRITAELATRRDQLAEVQERQVRLEDEAADAAARRAIDLEKQRQAAADILDLTQRTAQQRFQDGSRIDDLQARKALAGTSGSKKSSRALDKAISEQIKDEVAEAKNEYKRLVAEIKKAEDAGEGATDETQRMRKELEKALEVYRILRQEADRFNANVVTEAQKEAADQFSKRISAIEQFLSQSKEATGRNAVNQLQGRVDDPTVDREIKARRKAEFEKERDRLLGEAGFGENNLRKTKGGEIIAANRGDRKEVRDLIEQARKNTFGKKRSAEELAGERSSVRNDISQRLVDQLEKTGQIDKETAEALRKELDVQNETISSQLALKKSIDDLNKSLSGEGKTNGKKKDEVKDELKKLKGEQGEKLAPDDPKRKPATEAEKQRAADNRASIEAIRREQAKKGNILSGAEAAEFRKKQVEAINNPSDQAEYERKLKDIQDRGAPAKKRFEDAEDQFQQLLGSKETENAERQFGEDSPEADAADQRVRGAWFEKAKAEEAYEAYLYEEMMLRKSREAARQKKMDELYGPELEKLQKEQAAELAATGEKVLFADDVPAEDVPAEGLSGGGFFSVPPPSFEADKLSFDGDVDGPRQDSFNQPQRAPQTGTSQGGDDEGSLAEGFGGFAAGASQLAESSGALGSAIATGLQTLGGTLAAVSADQMAVSNMVAQLALQISQVVQANLDLGEDARGRGMAAGRRP
jgi:hypothetical protein